PTQTPSGGRAFIAGPGPGDGGVGRQCDVARAEPDLDGGGSWPAHLLRRPLRDAPVGGTGCDPDASPEPVLVPELDTAGREGGRPEFAADDPEPIPAGWF